MSEAKLGSLVGPAHERDAIHIAIVPVIAAENLSPGDHIGLNSEGKASIHAKKIGIVDPFLVTFVATGERFYLVLYPNTATGMRHHWFHPAFPVVLLPSGVEESAAFIRATAGQAGISYDELMEAASEFVAYRTYLCQGGRWEGFGVDDEFWDHYERVTGKKVVEDDRGSIFTCSC